MSTAPPLTECTDLAGETAMLAAAADSVVSEARSMIDTFASVGAAKFNVSWTRAHIRKPARPRTLRKTLATLGGPLPHADNEKWLDEVHIDGISTDDLRRTVPAMLDTATTERINLIVRPYGTNVMFIQLDDIDAGKLAHIATTMFLSLETSPNNFQAWIAVPGDHDPDFTRRVKRGVDSDLDATGAARICGSFNFKREYAPNYPRVVLHEFHAGRISSREELDRLGFVAPPEGAAPLSAAPRALVGSGKWPSWATALAGAPLNRKGTGPDRSRADFWFCYLAIQWGHGVEETAERLLQESPRASDTGESYAYHTAKQAALAVERDRQRSPRRA
jgi:hypothetical protein